MALVSFQSLMPSLAKFNFSGVRVGGAGGGGWGGGLSSLFLYSVCVPFDI